VFNDSIVNLFYIFQGSYILFPASLVLLDYIKLLVFHIVSSMKLVR